MNRLFSRGARVVLVLVAAVPTACGSSGRNAEVDRAATAGQVFGAESADAAIRTFLNAAAEDDYALMWTVFGTENGPAVERFGVVEVESRMVVLARLLRNSGYEMRVANRASSGLNRQRYEVSLEGTRKGNVVVPILTVPDSERRWYVEQLEMDALTAGSLP